MKKAALHNLGCKVNAYETEAMQEMLEKAGYEIVPFKEGADLYVINTCTVTNIADRKSRQMLHRARKMNPDAVVVAAGCYVQAKEKEIQEGLAKVASQRGIIEEQAARIRELEERLEKRPARPQVSYEVQVPMEQGKPPVQIPVEVERKRSNDVGRFKMLFEKRKARTDMVKLVSQADLSEGQLAVILAGMEQGLTQEQLTELVHCGATPEKMQIIVEIAVLENSMRREEA